MHNLGTFLLLLLSFPANSRQSVARFQQCEFNYCNLNNNRRELEETLTRQSEKLGGTEKGEEITSLGSSRLQEGVARLQLFKWSFNQFFVVNFPRRPPPSGRLLKYQMKDVFPPPINISSDCPGNLQSRSAIPFNQSNFFGNRKSATKIGQMTAEEERNVNRDCPTTILLFLLSFPTRPPLLTSFTSI